ncbi:hypothetical protein HF072_21165 [Bacillus sp. RO3]|nr:hypothetical protein [Bacillus sp. RO3]
MKRLLITFGLLMILVSSSLLFFQWMGFTTESAEESGRAEVNQSYSIIHKGNQFHVTQTIHFLSEIPENITIQWPSGAKDLLCLNDREEECLTKENGEFLVHNLHDDLMEIRISYTIEQPKHSGAMLLKDWHPVLSSITTLNTDIHIIEKSFRTGKWIAGYQSASHKKMDYIDYFSFNGNGGPSPLYWTEEQLLEKESANIRLFYDPDDISNIDTTSLSSLKGFVTVIMTSTLEPFYSPYLIVGNTEEEERIEELHAALLSQQYTFPDDEGYLKEFIVGVLMKRKPNDPQSARVYKEFVEGLSSSQLGAFRDSMVDHKEKNMNAKKLDELLGDATGFDSTFFSESTGENENVPLILTTSHPVNINGKPHHLSYISYKRREFIQFPQAVEALGLSVNELQPNVFYTTMNGNTFRFYVNEDYFIYNEENYGLLMNPVQTVGNSIYMDVHWFEKLFKGKVDKDEASIEM